MSHNSLIRNTITEAIVQAKDVHTNKTYFSSLAHSIGQSRYQLHDCTVFLNHVAQDNQTIGCSFDSCHPGW